VTSATAIPDGGDGRKSLPSRGYGTGHGHDHRGRRAVKEKTYGRFSGPPSAGPTRAGSSVLFRQPSSAFIGKPSEEDERHTASGGRVFIASVLGPVLSTEENADHRVGLLVESPGGSAYNYFQKKPPSTSASPFRAWSNSALESPILLAGLKESHGTQGKSSVGQ